MNRPKVYRLTITTLTPLHIGTGNQYILDYDYMTHGKKTWVLNQEACAEYVFDKNQMDSHTLKLVMERPFGETLSNDLQVEDYNADNPIFRYGLSGMPDSSARDAKVWEATKDMWDKPYVPGSSLKGAIRTAFLIRAMREGNQGQPVELAIDFTKSSKYVSAPIEQERFSGNNTLTFPYKDFFRILQISDLHLVEGQSVEPLALANIKVSNSNSVKALIPLEVVPQGLQFTGTLVRDEFLMTNLLAKETLRWDEHQLKWVRNIRNTVMKAIQDRLEDEVSYWQETPSIRRFYDGLIFQLENLAKDEFILQVGWGGGWNSKTMNRILTQSPKLFRDVIDKYRLDKNRGHEVFPNTRRIIAHNEKVPLGWIKVKMEEA